jgi:phosphate-selective porin OprO and OprP
MASKLYGGRRGHGALIALCAAVIPAAAEAQTAPIERIDAIERQIRNLQNELQQLKTELGEAKQQVRQSRGEAQRAKEEARQAQQAAEQARQNAARAAISETQAVQAAAQAQAAAVPPPPSPGSGFKLDFPGGRPTISSADGSRSFAVGTQIQFDMGGYFQNPTATTQFPHLNNGINLRRGRIFVVGKYGDW